VSLTLVALSLVSDIQQIVELELFGAAGREPAFLLLNDASLPPHLPLLLAGVDEDGVQDPCSWPSRFCTLFLYLNDVDAGGRTCFRWLDGSGSMPGDGIFSESLASLPSSSSGAGGASGSTAPPLSNELSIVPRTGLAIVHFPSTRLEFGCIPDPRTMHESEVAVDDKWIVQQFIWPVPIALHPLDRQGSTAMPSWHPDVLSEWEAIVSNAAVNASNTKTRSGDEIRSEMA